MAMSVPLFLGPRHHSECWNFAAANWHSGANSHVTPDLEAMDNSEAYYGDDALHVSNVNRGMDRISNLPPGIIATFLRQVSFLKNGDIIIQDTNSHDDDVVSVSAIDWAYFSPSLRSAFAAHDIHTKSILLYEIDNTGSRTIFICNDYTSQRNRFGLITEKKR
ncbi:hypothetical protein Tco_1377761 [Tanacetum coccineum]